MKEKTQQAIRDLMHEVIEQGRTAGLSFGVWQEDEELFFDAQGYADIGKKKPIRRDTIFRLYSMSKPVTAAAAMILVERGVLDLGQPVSDFLPGFGHLSVEKDGAFLPTDAVMTVKNLLDMTSGLTYGDEDTEAGRMTSAYIEECIGRMNTPEAVTTVEFADHMGTLPLAFAPNASWRYGLSADVLGAVIEKASGMTFGAFLSENLFEPLQMKDTGFWVPEEKQERLASAYEDTGSREMLLYTGNNLCISNRMDMPPAFESGGAGLVSTVDDYRRFAQMLLNGGSLDGVRVMSPEIVRYMTTGRLTAVQREEFWGWIGLRGHTYSNLMRVMDCPGRECIVGSKGEYGWDGWLGCYFANIPEYRMTILAMQQRKDSGTLSFIRRMRNLALCDL